MQATEQHAPAAKISSLTAVFDRTSDAGDREYAERLDEALTRHRREFSVMELGDVACDDALLAAVRTGNSALVGAKLLELVDERIARAAKWGAS